MAAEKRPRIPRLPLSDITKAAISMQKTGKRRSAETRAKISATLKGRPQTEGTRKALEEWRAKGCPRADRTERRRHSRRMEALKHRRLAQWMRDAQAAKASGDGALLHDVLMSKGYALRRRVHDQTGKVSSGFYVEQDRVVWLPKRVDRTRRK